jgi:hypothetical protein
MANRLKHGACRFNAETAEYQAWQSIKSRCYDPSHPGWLWCGYYGITVCNKWRYDFKQFLNDVGPKPGPDYVLSRKNKKLSYNPDNVAWVKREQAYRQRSNNRFFSVDNVRMCMADWAKKHGLNRSTLHYRLANGLSMKQALQRGHGKSGKLLIKSKNI